MSQASQQAGSQTRAQTQPPLNTLQGSSGKGSPSLSQSSGNDPFTSDTGQGDGGGDNSLEGHEYECDSFRESSERYSNWKGELGLIYIAHLPHCLTSCATSGTLINLAWTGDFWSAGVKIRGGE